MSEQTIVILVGIAFLAAGILGGIAQWRTEHQRAKRDRWTRYQAHVEAIEARRAGRHDQ